MILYALIMHDDHYIDQGLYKNKRPKGPHIVHLMSTMCHLFEESVKADIFVYSSA